MPSRLKQNEELLTAHRDFITNGSAELIELLSLVERIIPDKDDLKRKEWTKHMDRLCDVWQRRTDGEDVAWPDVCLIRFIFKLTLSADKIVMTRTNL